MNRELLPLALMYADSGETIEGRTRLQKLVFLLEQELKGRAHPVVDGQDYEFIAYDYGPFSKSLYDDLDELDEKGLVREVEETMDDGQVKYDYELTEDGREAVEDRLMSGDAEKVRELAQEFKDEYNDVLLSELIEYVYSKYPAYAENSVW